MLKSKKVISLLLVLVMIFALSANAFAVENGTVSLTIDIAGQSPETYTGVSITTGDTVYDVVNSKLGNRDIWTSTTPDSTYSPLRDSSSPLYDPNANAMILTKIDNYGSAAYVPSSVVEEYEDYVVGSDTVLDVYHNQYLSEYGGIAMWVGDGMAIMGDWVHMIYIGYDWTYTVNGTAPGISITPDANHPYDFFQYYMNEAMVNSGDAIVLTYNLNGTVFQ